MMQVRTAQWSLGVSGMTLLGIVAWARVPHGQALAAAVVLCMAAAGAAVSWYGARRRTEARTAAAVAAASEVPMPDLQGYVGEVDRQLEAARAEVAQTQTVFGDAILALFSSLKDISGQAHEQQALALGLTARGAMEGSSTGSKLTQCFDAFAKETDETLQFFVDATVQNSKLAMGLTDLIDNVRGQANAIQGALREVQAIAKQTDLLALNAAIEAARAGEAGRGFAVVADEVRMLSTRTSEFSRQIHVHIGTMHAASSSAERAIAEIASRDMNVALQSKRKVSQLMCDIGVVHGELQETASQLAQGTGKLAQEVGSAVAGMQLHSVITDLLSHVGTRIDALRAVTHSARPLACSAIDEGAARSGHSLLESAIRSARQATDRRDARLDAGKQRD